jgi:hypothetical protein
MQTFTSQVLLTYYQTQEKATERRLVGRVFTGDAQIPSYTSAAPLSGYAVSGTVSLSGPRAMARILLVDTEQREWLVYEGYPALVGGNEISVTDWCEETCVLPDVIPSHLLVELHAASLTLDEVSSSAPIESLTQEAFSFHWQQTHTKQNEYKIRQINTHMHQFSHQWVADHTTISDLPYREKKKMFTSKVPNLQGLEFYTRGIFEIPDTYGLAPPPRSSYPATFDWRNAHGASWTTPAKYQQGCGSCWAFAAVSVTETLINLYYNQHLNINISEQDVICRHPGSCLNGNYLHYGFDALRDYGLVTENCFGNVGTENCQHKCVSPDQYVWKISGYRGVEADDESIKRAIIEKGPISFGVSSLWHFMTAVGYETLSDGKTAWHIKNSWSGNWGEDGYVRMIVPTYDRYGLIYAERPYFAPEPERYEIVCTDNDFDMYCNWGISQEKPETCPLTCLPEKDCDDSDPTKGPADENERCVM